MSNAIVLAGAPGTGKGALAEAIMKSTSYGTYHEGLPADLQVGRNADYRAEIALASDRCIIMNSMKDAPIIFEHSLLDSVVYSTLRFIDFQERETSMNMVDKWMMVLGITSAMLHDTFQAGHVFFIPGGDPAIELALDAIVEYLDTPSTSLTGVYDDDLEVIEEWIKKNASN